MTNFKQYRRTQIAEMADWVQGFNMDRVSISVADQEAGSPKEGDKIARNPSNHTDRWLVAKDYFAANFEPLLEAQTGEAGLRGFVEKIVSCGFLNKGKKTCAYCGSPDYKGKCLHADNCLWVEAGRALSASAVAPTTGEVDAFIEALTPSDKTKAAYMGEFSIGFPERDGMGGEYTRHINVPWTTIKEIMAAIKARALRPSGLPVGGEVVVSKMEIVPETENGGGE